MSLWAAGQNRASGETHLVSLGRGRGLEKTEGAGHSRQTAGEEGEPKAVDTAPRGFAWVLICFFLDQVLKAGEGAPRQKLLQWTQPGCGELVITGRWGPMLILKLLLGNFPGSHG